MKEKTQPNKQQVKDEMRQTKGENMEFQDVQITSLFHRLIRWSHAMCIMHQTALHWIVLPWKCDVWARVITSFISYCRLFRGCTILIMRSFCASIVKKVSKCERSTRKKSRKHLLRWLLCNKRNDSTRGFVTYVMIYIYIFNGLKL